jgi:hypothetical protein
MNVALQYICMYRSLSSNHHESLSSFVIWLLASIRNIRNWSIVMRLNDTNAIYICSGRMKCILFHFVKESCWWSALASIQVSFNTQDIHCHKSKQLGDTVPRQTLSVVCFNSVLDTYVATVVWVLPISHIPGVEKKSELVGWFYRCTPDPCHSCDDQKGGIGWELNRGSS